MPKWTPIGEMRHPVTIEKPVASDPDAYGEITDTWELHRQVQAKVTELSGREYLAARQIQSALTHRVNCRYVPDVTSGMRLIYRGRYLYAESVIDLEGRQRELEILATEKT